MDTDFRRKVQIPICIGMFFLAAASILLTRFHLDFLSGIGFGIAIPTIAFAVYSMRRR